MESQITRNAQQEIDDALAEIAKIDQAKNKTAMERKQAEQRLQGLKDEFPCVLAARALGQATDAEVSALKQAINALEVIVPDFPLTLTGLEELEKPIQANLRGPRRLLKKLGKYERTRNELEEGGSVSAIGPFRVLAGVLGLEEDAETTIKSLPQMRT